MDTSNEVELRPVWFESAGSRLFSIDKGQGRTPLLFFHGGLADHRASLFRVGRLAVARRVVMPDLRGSGRSTHAGDLSWDLLADDAVALLDHLGIERAIVGGVSAGSAVALRFALRHPPRALALVIESPVYAGDGSLTDAQLAAFRTMEEVGRRALAEGIEVLRPLYERLPEAVREAALQMMQSFDPASVAATTRFLATGAQPFQTATELAAIEVPVLLIPGTDPEHPAQVCALYARHLPRSTTVDPASPDLLERIDAFCQSC